MLLHGDLEIGEGATPRRGQIERGKGIWLNWTALNCRLGRSAARLRTTAQPGGGGAGCRTVKPISTHPKQHKPHRCRCLKGVFGRREVNPPSCSIVGGSTEPLGPWSQPSAARWGMGTAGLDGTGGVTRLSGAGCAMCAVTPLKRATSVQLSARRSSNSDCDRP